MYIWFLGYLNVSLRMEFFATINSFNVYLIKSNASRKFQHDVILIEKSFYFKIIHVDINCFLSYMLSSTVLNVGYDHRYLNSLKQSIRINSIRMTNSVLLCPTICLPSFVNLSITLRLRIVTTQDLLGILLKLHNSKAFKFLISLVYNTQFSM